MNFAAGLFQITQGRHVHPIVDPGEMLTICKTEEFCQPSTKKSKSASQGSAALKVPNLHRYTVSLGVVSFLSGSLKL